MNYYGLPESETEFDDVTDTALLDKIAARKSSTAEPVLTTWAATQAQLFAACYSAACDALAGQPPEVVTFAAGEIYRKAEAIA